MYNNSKKGKSEIAKWIISYVAQEKITLADLARSSNLSHGTLRSLINYSERRPTYETCLRLADATGKPVEEIFEMAGLSPKVDPSVLHPDRYEVLHIFDTLPTGSLRQVFLGIGRALMDSTNQDSK